jgi:hypothetical protein
VALARTILGDLGTGVGVAGMHTPRELDYRLRLGEGFLAEAQEDLLLRRWRSCVDNSQADAQRSLSLAQEAVDLARGLAGPQA